MIVVSFFYYLPPTLAPDHHPPPPPPPLSLSYDTQYSFFVVFVFPTLGVMLFRSYGWMYV